MPGITGLRKMQFVPEAVAGTAIAATAIWRGPAGDIEDTRETVFVEEHTGYMSGEGRTNVSKLGADYSMPSTEATYEQLLHVLEAGIEMDAAPVADGAGPGKIWSFAMPTTAGKTPQTYTIEAGDNQQAYEMEYSFVREFSLSGDAGDPLMVDATWEGRQKTSCSFTAALEPIAVHEINMGHATVFIDNSGGTVGGTPVSDTVLGMNLSVTTGFQGVHTMDSGELYFAFLKQIPPEIELQLTMEYNDTSEAEYEAWRAETVRQIRIQFTGPALTNETGTYDNYTLILDMAGKWSDFEILGEQDGNDIVTGTFRPFYSSTDTLYFEVTLVNEVAAL